MKRQDKGSRDVNQFLLRSNPRSQEKFCSTLANIPNLKYNVIMYRKNSINVCKTKYSRLGEEILNILYTSLLYRKSEFVKTVQKDVTQE